MSELRFDDVLRNYLMIFAHGSVVRNPKHRQVAKLLRLGFVSPTGNDRGTLREFAITEAGRRALAEIPK